MNRPLIVSMALITSFALSLGAFAQGPEDGPTLYQVSNITALKAGSYKGTITIGELQKHGNFGIGTLDGLDGEMVVLDGVFYQVKSSGEVIRLKDHLKAPFAVVTFFKPLKSASIRGEAPNNYKGLKDRLDSLINPGPGIYAIKIEGIFNKLKLRSPPKQSQPYPTLIQALKGQSIFNRKETSGTMVGVRFPQYMSGVNASGYHFHFISSNGRVGGHLLDCSPRDIRVFWQRLERFVMDDIPERDSATKRPGNNGSPMK